MLRRALRAVGLFMLLILLAGLLVYRMLFPTLPVPEIRPHALTLPRLAITEELERVGARATRLTRNDLGFWEADFDGAGTMILAPGGTFKMGNDALGREVTGFAAAPAHPVTLSPYWIGKTPVTIGQFRRFVDATGYVTNVEQAGHPGPWVYDFDARGFVTKQGHRWDNAFHQVTARFPELIVDDRHPAANISWYDCIAYANWLTERHNLPFTLPSEAEWEYAARGQDGRVYPWGNSAPDGTRANYADTRFDRYFPGTEQSLVHHGVDDGFAITSPVGAFPAGRSPLGALDMAGNLTEWVFDGYRDYAPLARTDPVQLEARDIRMQKGGFWAGSAGRFDVTPDEIEFGHNIRSDSRQGDDPASADDHLGCRLAISYTPRRAE